MKLLLFTLGFGLLQPAIRFQDEYVCSPCGYECDYSVHAGPGTCASCGMALVKKSSIKFKNLSLDEFCQRLSANPKAILLDVRSGGEFNGTTSEVPTFGHFTRAININVEELENRISELSKYKHQEVLVYCSHNHRSPRASYLLGVNGFTNVKNMTGGVSTFSGNPIQACLTKEFVFHAH